MQTRKNGYLVKNASNFTSLSIYHVYVYVNVIYA